MRAQRPSAAPATLAVLLGSAASVAAAFATRIVLARHLGPGGFGLFTQGVAIATATGGCAALGLGAAGARRVSLLRAAGEPDGPRRAARTAIATGACSGAGASLLLFGLAPALAGAIAKPDLTRTLWALVPVVLALALGNAALGVARAFGDIVGRALWRDALGGLLRVAGVLVALAWGAGPAGAALGFAGGSLAGELAFVGYATAHGWWRPALLEATHSGTDWRWDRELWRSLPPYAGMAVIVQAAQWFDVLLLGALAPVAVVGVYGVARGLERVLELVSEAGAHRFLPAATQALHRQGPAALAELYRETRRITLALLWPPLLLCLLAPAALLSAVFGPPYAESGATALRLLAAGLLISAALGYNDRALLAAGDEVAVARITLMALLAGAVTAVGLVPRYGATGAAAGWLAMIVLQNLLCTRRLARRVGVPTAMRDLLELNARTAGPPLAVFVALRLANLPPLPSAGAAAVLAAILGLLQLRATARSPG